MQERNRFFKFYRLIKRHRILFWVITIICTALSGFLMSFFLEPQYESRAQLLVNQHIESEEREDIFSMGQLEANIELINTYGDIFFGTQVLEEVNQRLDGQYYVNELRSALTLTQSLDSQSFYIKARMDSPLEAQQVLNTVIEEFQEFLAEIYGDEYSSVIVLSEPSYNPNMVAPSLGRFIFIGAVMGIFISVIMICWIELSDSRINSIEDLMQFGMNNLGEINLLSRRELKYSRPRQVKRKKVG